MKDQIENLIDEIHVKVENAETDPVCTGVNIDLTFEEADLIVRGLAGLKHVTAMRDNRKEVFGDTEHRSPYQVTVAGMLSPDYKERFKAEYQQTKIRYEKLKAFCNRIEAAMRTYPGDTKRVQMPEHDCPLDLLHDQQRAMGEYLHCLEIRAVIEGIEL
jgi:hypothetical protein